jgi:hypothetical protein
MVSCSFACRFVLLCSAWLPAVLLGLHGWLLPFVSDCFEDDHRAICTGIMCSNRPW